MHFDHVDHLVHTSDQLERPSNAPLSLSLSLFLSTTLPRHSSTSHGNRFHVVVFDKKGKTLSEFECPYVKVSRCCGLKITSEGYVVTLAKNNHHVLVLNTLYIL